MFKVLNEVVNPRLEPFTVTMPAFGNNLNRGSKDGFEPITFRTRMVVGEDSPDKVIASSKKQIDNYDSWASGYLDGGTVRVYRIVDGELKLVRTDTIPAGGTVIAEWNYNGGKVVPPGTTEGYWKWAPWSRPGTTDWFTVMAVDQAGNTSAGTPVSLARPDVEISQEAPPGDTESFRADKNSDDSDAPPAPQNVQGEVMPDGSVRLTWDPVDDPDIAGYFIAQSDVDPAEHKGVYLQLSESPEDPSKHLKKGDMLIVETEFRTFDRKLRSNRTANLWRTNAGFYPDNLPSEFYPGETPGTDWTLQDHPKDTPVSEPGRTYLEMTLAEGVEQKVGKSGIPDISTTKQDYYPVPKPVEYKMEVWMKADRADAPPVTFEFDGDRKVGGFLEPFTFQPTTEWQKFEHTFTGQPAEDGHHAYFVLTCNGPATYSIDNYRIYEADAPYLGLTADEEKKYADSGMMAMRTHGPIKTGTGTYSMDAFTNPGGVVQGVPGGNTLPQELAAIEKLGTRPWLQIEYHMSPDEWLGFVEFMAAPYDPAVDSPETKPWAAKRYAQGRQEPWTDAFDRIYFELSNETWNSLFAPWVFESMPDSATGKNLNRGEVYGKMQDLVADTFRSSPYWSPELEEKFVHVLGGWAIGDYSEKAVQASDSGEFITIAAYNGGWDEGEGTPKPEPPSFFNVLSQANTTAIPRAREVLQLKLDAASVGKTIALGTYEAGPGYALNGLNNAKVTKEQSREQEEVMKSKVAGTATIDSFLAHAYYGFTLQNFFTFEEGDLWKSHAKWWRGGQAYPSFLGLTMFNQLATGDMLRTETLSVTTVDLPELKRRKPLANAPMAAVYATRQGDRVSLFCINREYPGYPDEAISGFTPFEVQLPFTKAAKVTLHRLSGAPTDHNIESELVKLEALPIPAEAVSGGKLTINEATGGDAQGLPPAEVFLYVFEGTDIAPEASVIPQETLLSDPMEFTGN